MGLGMKWRSGFAVALVVLAAGCGSSGGETIEVSLADLPCQMQNAAGIWESAPLPPITDEQCLWFLFRANNTYIFEHPLGRVPLEIIAYIAFDSDGTGSTIASGNAFLLNAVDASTITIKNAQNQDFWLRLVLE